VRRYPIELEFFVTVPPCLNCDFLAEYFYTTNVCTLLLTNFHAKVKNCLRCSIIGHIYIDVTVEK
jgi:hypothetical protein